MATKAESAALIYPGDRIKNDIGTVTVKAKEPLARYGEGDRHWRFYFHETAETRVYGANKCLHRVIGIGRTAQAYIYL